MGGVRDGGMLDLGAVLEEIRHEIRPHFGKGRVARYIPALKRVPADKFGIAVALRMAVSSRRVMPPRAFRSRAYRSCSR